MDFNALLKNKEPIKKQLPPKGFFVSENSELGKIVSAEKKIKHPSKTSPSGELVPEFPQ